MRDFTVHNFDSEDAWLDARRSRVTSSDAPALLGVSPYPGGNAFDLWLAKRGPTPDPGKMRRRFAVGHALEPLVARWVEEELGSPIVRPSEAPHYLVVDDALPWAAATPDFLAPAPDDDAVIEVKSAQGDAKNTYEESAAFRYASTQTQHSMLVTGATRGYIAVVFGMGLDFRLIPVAPSPQMHQILGVMGERFHRHLTEGTPPGEEFVLAGAEVKKAIAAVLAEENGEEITLEDEWLQRAKDLDTLNGEIAMLEAQKKEFEAAADEIRSRFQLRMGSATCARIPGYDKIARFTMRRGGAANVDTRWERRTFSLTKDPATKRR